MMKFIKIFLFGIFIVIVLGLGVLTWGYFWIAKDLPKIRKITDYTPCLTTTVFSRNGTVLGYFYKQNRFLFSLKDVPSYVPRAFLAAEDSEFYHHKGIDFWGIVRAAIKNIEAGTIVQGGSTITQQVVKSILLSPERSYKRKLKEAILAYRLEKYLTKDEILSIYLTQIYLGAGAYGVEAAARIYFGKHAKELTLAEAAVLAGLPKAPSYYNPYKHPQRAKLRQKYVLNRMLKLRWISEKEYEKAISYPLIYKKMEDPSWKIGPYFLEEVRRSLIQRYGEEKTYCGGLKVYTSLDIKHQRAAEQALRAGLIASTKRRGFRGPIFHISKDEYKNFLEATMDSVSELVSGKWIKVLVVEVRKDGAEVRFGKNSGWIPVESMRWCRKIDPKKAPEEVPPVKDATKVLKKGDIVFASFKKYGPRGSYILKLQQEPLVEGALVSMDPRTGEVLALVGGYDFHRSQFDRAVQAKRQTGSAFKPIVYSAALDNGFTAASVILDAPIVYWDKYTNSIWRPENYERTVYGPTLFRTALVYSRNLVTIRIGMKIGIDKVIERAKALGLEADFPENLSVCLGTASVSLINLCKAYTGFARLGTTIDPIMILKIEDAFSREIDSFKPEVKKAITPQNAYIMTYLMQQVVKYGTGWRAKALKRPVAGKTGTTDEQKDAWFMGFTPYLLTGVYVGFDVPSPMGKYETGSRAACPIFVMYRKKVEEDYPVEDFKRPPGIVMARIDAKNGLLAGPNTKESYILPFIVGTEPKEISKGEENVLKEGNNGLKEDVLKNIF
jgi:penicillin-binding protein 1A